MINLLRVSDLYRQHSIVQATFRFDHKSPAFKRLLDAKNLIPLWIRLGDKSESLPHVSTQKMRNIVNSLDSYYQKKSGTIPTKMGCIEPLKQKDKENKLHKGLYS